MADRGVTATVTPEDEANMGHGFPPIARLIKAGVTPNIGVGTCIAVGGDQFTAMRFALAVPRAQSNGAQLDAGENPWNLKLTARDAARSSASTRSRCTGPRQLPRRGSSNAPTSTPVGSRLPPVDRPTRMSPRRR